MKLSIKDRIVLHNILPSEGSFVTLKIVRDLREALGFSEAEVAEFEIRQEGADVHWNADKAVDKEVEIGPAAAQVIRSALSKLDQQQKLTPDLLGVYERFVGTDATP